MNDWPIAIFFGIIPAIQRLFDREAGSDLMFSQPLLVIPDIGLR